MYQVVINCSAARSKMQVLFSNKLKDQLGHVKDSLAYEYLQLPEVI